MISPQYLQLTTAIKTYADGFIAIAAKYTPANGGLSEQFDKGTGQPLSAVDLTWSYASALTAFGARAGTKTASWGAKGLTVPSQCASNAGPTVSVTFNVQATTQIGGAHSLFVPLYMQRCSRSSCREHLHHWFGKRLGELVS